MKNHHNIPSCKEKEASIKDSKPETISVIIPTYNRKDVLLKAIEAMLQQTYPSSNYEVLVIDDGSSDGTRKALRPLAKAGKIRYHFQRNKGPAAARNAGVKLARGAIVLFIGDDILVPPDLLELHQTRRNQFPDQKVAVLGKTIWSPKIKLTPLMRYSQEGHAVPTFQFDQITDPNNVSYKFFFTGNISLPKQFMLENGLFDEDFHYAYGEDTELGYRLQQKGLRIVFEPKALTYHYHLLRYRDFRRRAMISGKVSILHVTKHPEWADLEFLKLRPRAKVKHLALRILVKWVLDPLLTLADQRQWSMDGLPTLYDWTLRYHTFTAQLKTVKHHKFQ